MPDNMMGISFAPTAENRLTQASGGPLQEAIQLLSLRLPKMVGARSPIPQGLLASGAGPSLGNSVVQSILAQILGQAGGGPMGGQPQGSPQSPWGGGPVSKVPITQRQPLQWPTSTPRPRWTPRVLPSWPDTGNASDQIGSIGAPLIPKPPVSVSPWRDQYSGAGDQTQAIRRPPTLPTPFQRS